MPLTDDEIDEMLRAYIDWNYRLWMANQSTPESDARVADCMRFLDY